MDLIVEPIRGVSSLSRVWSNPSLYWQKSEKKETKKVIVCPGSSFLQVAESTLPTFNIKYWCKNQLQNNDILFKKKWNSKKSNFLFCTHFVIESVFILIWTLSWSVNARSFRRLVASVKRKHYSISLHVKIKEPFVKCWNFLRV